LLNAPAGKEKRARRKPKLSGQSYHSRDYTGGYLTLLFQAKEELSLHVGLFYCSPPAPQPNEGENRAVCSCQQEHIPGEVQPRRKPHKHPSEILITVSWWLVQAPSKGGVLRVCRLVDTDHNLLGRVHPFDTVPVEICIPGIGLHSDATVGTSIRGAKQSCLANNLRHKALQLMRSHRYSRTTGANSADIVFSSHLSTWIGSPSHFDDIIPEVSGHIKPSELSKCWICGDRQLCHWKPLSKASGAALKTYEKNDICAGRVAIAMDQDMNEADKTAVSANQNRHNPRIPPHEIKRKKSKVDLAPADTASTSANHTFAGNHRDMDSFEKTFTKVGKTDTVDSEVGPPTRSKQRRALYGSNILENIVDLSMPPHSDGSSSNNDYDVELRATSRDVNNAKMVRSSSSPVCSETEGTRIGQLETELAAAKAETELILRKADRRFQEEKRMRIAFNVDRSSWDIERQELQRQMQTYKEAAAENQKILSVIVRKQIDARNSMMRLFDCINPVIEQASTTSEQTGLNGNGHRAFSGEAALSVLGLNSEQVHAVRHFASPQKAAAPTHLPALIEAPFCVACQTQSADVCLVPCGHICLCFDHVCTMQTLAQLTLCPVCKAGVESVCRVNGLLADGSQMI
jgi:hypothetical protein